MRFEEEWLPVYPDVRDFMEINYVYDKDANVPFDDLHRDWSEYEAEHVPEGEHLPEGALDWHLAESMGYRQGFDPESGLWSWQGLRKREVCEQ